MGSHRSQSCVSPVIMFADPDGTPKDMYAALGFGPLVLTQEYQKDLPASNKESS